MSDLVIDTEFRDLIPPLAAEELQELEGSLLRDGCLDPLKAWHGTIVDGHNRYAICQKHCINFKVTDMSFIDRDDAKVWILRNQLARRNLNTAQRVMVAEKLRPLIAPKARERREATLPQKGERGFRPNVCQKSDEHSAPINTNKEIAKLADVSHDTVGKVKVVMEHGSEDQRDRMLKGKASVNKVYREIVPVKPKADDYLIVIKALFDGITLGDIKERQAACACPLCGK